MMDDILHKGFRFGAVRACPLEGWIEGPGGIEHVPPKVMGVLVCLARRSGHVVDRERIFADVWDSQTSDDALTHCISELRRVLHDHAENPTYVETIPKKGYRLIPEVLVQPIEGRGRKRVSQSVLGGLWEDLKDRKVIRVAIAYSAVSWLALQVSALLIEGLDLPDWTLTALIFVLLVGFLAAVVVAWFYQLVPERTPAEQKQRRRMTQGVDVSIILFLAAALLLLAYRQFVAQPLFAKVVDLPETMTSPEPRERSVAVMRFDSFGGDTAFSNGLSEHLLNLLAQVPELDVPSRQVTWALSDEKLDPRSMAVTLRVRYLLEGSVQQSETKIRVTAQLIDGASGNHVWSESYDESLSADNFFSIQDRIAEQVVAKLQATLDASVLKTPPTTDDEALRHYLTGRERLNEPKTDESMTAAVAAFEAAIERDPRYAEAYAGLCEAHLARYVIYQNTDHFDAAEAACVRASRINPNLGEVHAALGSLYRNAGQLEEAATELIRARQLLNGPAFVLEELGLTYRAQGKLLLAEQTFNEAIVKEPANWSVYKSMGNFLFRTGRYGEALPYYKQVLIMQPNSALGYSNIGSAFFMRGEFDDASVAWRQSLKLDPTHFAYMNYANSLFYQGRYAQSVEMYREAIKLAPNDARAWGSLGASCQQTVGEEACAQEAFARAVELFEEALRIDPLGVGTLSRLARYYARLGMRAEATEALAKLTGLTWDDYEVSYFIALAQLDLGDRNAAITELNRAIVLGYPRVLVAADPGLAPIRGELDLIETAADDVD